MIRTPTCHVASMSHHAHAKLGARSGVSSSSQHTGVAAVHRRRRIIDVARSLSHTSKMSLVAWFVIRLRSEPMPVCVVAAPHSVCCLLRFVYGDWRATLARGSAGTQLLTPERRSSRRHGAKNAPGRPQRGGGHPSPRSASALARPPPRRGVVAHRSAASGDSARARHSGSHRLAPPRARRGRGAGTAGGSGGVFLWLCPGFRQSRSHHHPLHCVDVDAAAASLTLGLVSHERDDVKWG